jgi:hypothetical protein
MEKKCATCALKSLQGGMCPIFRANTEDENGCPQHTSHIDQCAICGGMIIKEGTYYIDDNVMHIVCPTCVNGHPCTGCENFQTCRLMTDQSCPEPLYVMQTMQQGNMVVQQQVINPKRVQAICPQCKCYNTTDEGEQMCFQNENCSCHNKKIIWRT